MDNDRIIRSAERYVRELFRGNSGGHDADHTLRVYRNAMLLADTEPGCDRTVVALAALLHDADDHKLFRTENNRNAREFLKENNIPDETADSICEIINGVSFSRNRGRVPGTVEGRIVQDADRLDSIGAVGIARTFAYGGEHGRPMSESVQHFHDKLLLIGDRMNTSAATEIAMKRHSRLVRFLEELAEETGDSSGLRR